MANSVSIIDGQGKAAGSVAITVTAKKKISPTVFATAVKVLHQNWRQGTVKCKSRGEVNASGHKPWRQKGTGRARAGMASSPLWIGGGVVFGPQPRTRTLKISQQQRAAVLNNLLHERMEAGAIHCINVADLSAPSTKRVAAVLKAAGLGDVSIVTFVAFGDLVAEASFRNIATVTVLYFDEPNVFDLSKAQHWVFLQKDVSLFNTMVARWN